MPLLTRVVCNTPSERLITEIAERLEMVRESPAEEKVLLLIVDNYLLQLGTFSILFITVVVGQEICISLPSKEIKIQV